MKTENNSTIIYQKEVTTSRNNRRKLLKELDEIIKDISPKTSLSEYEILLVLDEAITNAMEHGNRWEENKKVKVTAIKKRDGLEIKVKDEGIGFNFSNIKKRLPKGKKLSTRGRGIYIMRKLADISWNEFGNEITIKLKFKDGE